MSEEVAKPEDGDESSMEDILSSIRDILSDEEEGSEKPSGSDSNSDSEDADVSAAPNADKGETAAESEIDNEAASATETEPEPEVASEAEADSEVAADTKPDADSASENETAPDVEMGSEGIIAELTDDAAADSSPQVEHVAEQRSTKSALDQETVPPAMEAILELTPDMIATEIMSKPTATASTDVLSELAAAILDRRDMAVDTSRNQMTLEGIVREMLKPILREWLDRNLPYLIERLVKREIDLMVNRAERLED
ncbi:MAG: hypothetical protein CMF69_10700 [Magnetovibrio sp.]|nr:hypothetical protein [Magnetovibrio sp.]